MEETANKIEMKNIASTNILAMGYSKELLTLQVSFKGGRVYQYTPVQEDTYNTIINAQSVGSMFHEHIKNNTNINFKKL